MSLGSHSNIKIMNLQLIENTLLPAYLEKISAIAEKLNALREAEISTGSFSFYTSVASVFSSKIEGEDIDLDSYIKHKSLGVVFQPDYTKKTDDLYNAYQFAKENDLNPDSIKLAHRLLSKNLIAVHQQGELRTNIMYVVTDEGKIEYVAASPYDLEAEMNKWNDDLNSLLKLEMNAEEVFFYAAMLHLTFVKIHPWNDGNGRCARLIEKWFIASKLGKNAWLLQSEKYYYLNHAEYYHNLRVLGLEYDFLKYDKAFAFLLMLPACLDLK